MIDNEFENKVYKAYDEVSLIAALNEIRELINIQPKSVNASYVLELENRRYNLNETIEIRDFKNLSINGNGAQLVWTEHIRALNIFNCNNLKLTNFSIDYDPLPFMQGVISSADGQQLRILLDKGYPDNISIFKPNSQIYLCVHDSDTLAPLAGSNATYYISSVNQISPTEIGAYLLRSYDCYGSLQPKIGQVVSLYQRGVRSILIEQSESVVFENIDMYSSPGFGVTEWNSRGGAKFLNCNFVPGPKPVSAKRERARCINADAFHFASIEEGPVFDGCSITHCGDDCINVHGCIFFVVEVNGKEIYLSSKYLSKVEDGDKITAHEGVTFASFGEATVLKQQTVIREDLRETVAKLYADSCGGHSSDTELQRVILDREIVGLKCGDSVIPTTRVGNGTIVRNCKLGFNRARGLLLKGDNVLIENNTITSCTDSALLLFVEHAWQEGGFLTNLTVRNNTINNCCHSAETIVGKSESVADIVVGCSKSNDGGFCENFENKNVLIEGNTSQNSGGHGIFICNASDVCIKDNIIKNPFTYGINKIASDYKIVPNSGIFIAKCKNASIENNQVFSEYEAVEKAVEIADGCLNLTEKNNRLSRFI